MAFRIADSVERGWLDASVRGRVTGEIWLRGRAEPLRLDLEGYPMADLAGRMLSFENPRPAEKENIEGLATEQKGTVGDLTASRKALHGDPPYVRSELKTVNVLYLEWFSHTNGRVVIEAIEFNLSMHGEPAWELTEDLEEERQHLVGNGMNYFMEQASRVSLGRREEEPEEDWTPMDEYQWEKELKESDARTEKYGKLLEKYQDHPDQERIIAREMGWDHLEDMLDADERGVYDEAKRAHEEEGEDSYPELKPNPETEGEDWMHVEDGDVRHPLAHKAFELSIRLHHLIKDLGFEDDDAESGLGEALHVMTFAAHMLSAKLAGALNGLAYDRDFHYMAGMIVAQLKRALSHFNEAIHRMEQVMRDSEDLKEPLTPYRDELFEIREEMLRLMQKYRAMIS